MRNRCLIITLVLLWLSATALWAADAGDPLLHTGPDALNLGVGKLTVNGVVVDPTVAHTGYAPVRMATTANITLSGVQTIDGIGGAVNDRVLVKNQTTGSENGIYVMLSGAWSRATDMDTSVELAGFEILVREGTTQEGTVWRLASTGALTLGTSALSFVQDTLACGTPGGPVCSDEGTGAIPGTAMAYPGDFVTTPPTCSDGKEWRYDTTQDGKYRLAICVGGEGENPLTEPYVSTIDQVCIDGGDCETIPAGQDGTLNIITGTNVTASVARTGNVIDVTINSSGGGGGSRRVSHPLKLMTLEPSNANAIIATTDGTNFPWSAVRFVDNATGCAAYSHRISANLAATEAWTLKAAHKAASGSGGNAVITLTAKSFGTNEAFDASLSALLTTTTVAVSTSANTTLSTLPSSGDFDSEEPLVAGELLVLLFCRVGGNASDDLSAAWDLLDLAIEYLEEDP